MRNLLEKGMKMRKVKVKRLDLLDKIKGNRTKHIAEYEEAVVGYHEALIELSYECIEKLKAHIEEVKGTESGGTYPLTPNPHRRLTVPKSHEKDYDQVIMMLEMSVDNELEISSDEFACYAMDDWDWKQDFLVTSEMYNKKG